MFYLTMHSAHFIYGYYGVGWILKVLTNTCNVRSCIFELKHCTVDDHVQNGVTLQDRVSVGDAASVPATPTGAVLPPRRLSAHALTPPPPTRSNCGTQFGA